MTVRVLAYPRPRGTATNALAIATATAGLLAAAVDPGGYAAYLAGFIPARLEGAELEPGLWGVPALLTPLSAALVHAGVLHLAMNLVMLLFTGREVEPLLGGRRLLLLYAIGAYAAAAGHWAAAWLPQGWWFAADPAAPMVGASGAISALLAVYALACGSRRARALGPFSAPTVHAAWLAAAWTAINLLVSVVLPIAWGAHVGGFVAGLVLARPMLRWRRRAV